MVKNGSWRSIALEMSSGCTLEPPRIRAEAPSELSVRRPAVSESSTVGPSALAYRARSGHSVRRFYVLPVNCN